MHGGLGEWGRKACLSARAEREGGGGGWGRGGEGRRRGFSIMKFEICRTSKASVAKLLWQQSREEECITFSPSVFPHPSFPPPSLFLSIPPSLLKCVSLELGWGAWGWVEGEREKGWEELIRRVGGWGWLKDGLGERKMDERGVLYIYTRVCVRVCACMNNRFYQASLNTACVCMRTCMCAGPWRGECALW